MKIQIQCPHCELVLEVDDQFAGQRMTCGSCSGEFVVPGGQSAAGKVGGGAPAPRRHRAGARHGGRSRPRSEPDLRFDDEEPRRRVRPHSRDSSPMVKVALVLGVLAVAGLVIYGLASQDEGMFDQPQEPEVFPCTQADVENVVRFQQIQENNFRTSVRNIWRAETTPGPESRKTLVEMEAAQLRIRDSLARQVLIDCPAFDAQAARVIIDQVLRSYEVDERQKMEAAKER